MDIKEEGLVNPYTNWYYQAKLYAIKELLSDNTRTDILVDVGAGSGFFGKEIAKHFSYSKLILIDTGYSSVTQAQDEKINYHDNCPHIPASTYLFVDVLEHIELDLEVLSHYVSESAFGARFILTVPAFQFLWSPHDEFLDHKRRYTKKMLSKLASDAGLSIDNSYYIFSFVFPIIFLKKRFFMRKGVVKSSLREYPPIINFLLRKICVIEHRYFKNPWFGTSVILFGTKA